jgi:hypothetical protein
VDYDEDDEKHDKVAAEATTSPILDERKPPAKPSKTERRQILDEKWGDGIFKAVPEEEGDGLFKAVPDNNNTVQIAQPRYDAQDEPMNPFLAMMGPQPDTPVILPPAPSPSVVVSDDDLKNYTDIETGQLVPPGNDAADAQVPSRAASARRESFDEKDAFSLPPEPGSVSRRRGPPRAQKPGAEFVRLRAPGMRPSWFEGRQQRSDSDEIQAPANVDGQDEEAGEHIEEEEEAEAEETPNDGDDSLTAVLGANPDATEEMPPLSPATTADVEEPATVDWTTASCTPMPRTSNAYFGEEMSPVGEERSLPKAQRNRCCLLVTTYGFGLLAGIGIGMIVWVIYDRTK